MPSRRSALVSGALLGALFVIGLAGGYVYQHEPARDSLDVQVSSSGAAPGVRTVNGTIASIEAGRLTLTTSGGNVVIPLPPGALVDELIRATEGFAPGTRVNVGVESTQYGLVLTGLVAVEGAR